MIYLHKKRREGTSFNPCSTGVYFSTEATGNKTALAQKFQSLFYWSMLFNVHWINILVKMDTF